MTTGASSLRTGSSTSSSLLERARALDPDAWDRLSQIYGPLVYAWSREHGVNDNDAADVAQEVFRAVHRSLPDFQIRQPEDSFRGWLWTITRNKIRDFYRARAAQPDAAGGTDAGVQWSQLPDAEPESTGLGNADPVLMRALEFVRVEFTAQTWQAFWRCVVDGADTSDVADELGMTGGAVRTARSRVLGRLRKEMRDLMGE